MKYYLDVWRKFADFRGRARRKEYWMFALIHVIVAIVAMGLDYATGLNFKFPGGEYGDVAMPYGYLYMAYILASFIPSLAVGVRRLHDVGKSGWFYLVALIPLIGGIWLLVLFFTDSQPGTNKWGPNPKQVESDPLITY